MSVRPLSWVNEQTLLNSHQLNRRKQIPSNLLVSGTSDPTRRISTPPTAVGADAREKYF